MNIVPENLITNHLENKNFNDEIQTLVSELLQTNTFGKIDYVISDSKNFNLVHRHHYHPKNRNIKGYLKPQQDKEIKRYEKYKGLGPLEFSLVLYLLNKDIAYNVILLTGALGSGKSSLCNYTLDYIKEAKLPNDDIINFPDNGIIYRIDLNDFDDNDTEEVIDEFKLELLNQLISLISEIHEKELFIDLFIKKILEYSDDRFKKFSEYERRLRRENRETEEERFDYLLDWLNGYENLSYKLRLVTYILAFVKEKNENDKVDFIIFIDNIDKLNDNVQFEILNLIFSFSIKLPIKILVPMRLTTFGKLKGNGSYSFGVLENTGHPPVSILLERLKHYDVNYLEYKTEKKVSPEYLIYFNVRVKQLIYELENSNVNRLMPFYNAISGNSIRRGLFLSERFFINSVIKYDEKSFTQDDFAKSLLIDNNDNGILYNDDRLLNNLLANYDNSVTLLKIRILQILDFYRLNNWTCKMNILLSQISLFEEYTNDEILGSINDLINVPRRLLYIEGVKEYKDFNILSQSSNDIIQLTYSGYEYLNTLVYNVVYLQCIIIPVNWKVPNSFRNLEYLSSYIEELNEKSSDYRIKYLYNLIESRKINIKDFISPRYDHSQINERMRILRECLYFLMLIDLNQLAIYYESNSLKNIEAVDNRYINHSIISDIIGKVSIAVINIIRSTTFHNTEEIKNWYDILLISQLWHKTMFLNENMFIAQAIIYYEKEGLGYKA